MPRVQVENCAIVVAEVTQQPPETLCAAHRSVGDDEDAGADARGSGRSREVAGGRKRMASALSGRRRQVGVHVEEARTGYVPGEVELTAALRLTERPAAVDELVAQSYQLPPLDCGSGTEGGWITYTMPPVALIHASSN